LKLKIDNLNINYIIKGKGKPILLLEGWNTNLNVYKRLIEHLSNYRKVYAFDFPGFGESDEPKEAWKLDDYVIFTEKIINKFNLNNFDIIVHSFGGRVLIKSFPLKYDIDKIIMVSPAGIKNKENIKLKLKKYLYKIVKNIFVLKNYYIKKYASVDYKNASLIMRKTLVNIINENLYSYLSNIDKECLLIWGENDNQTPLNNAYIMKSLIKDSGLCIIKNSGHFCFLEKEEHFYKIIDTYLEYYEK
jgi:pimeloyl-ACP methyl ester carboxylesterase